MISHQLQGTKLQFTDIYFLNMIVSTEEATH